MYPMKRTRFPSRVTQWKWRASHQHRRESETEKSGSAEYRIGSNRGQNSGVSCATPSRAYSKGLGKICSGGHPFGVSAKSRVPTYSLANDAPQQRPAQPSQVGEASPDGALDNGIASRR